MKAVLTWGAGALLLLGCGCASPSLASPEAKAPTTGDLPPGATASPSPALPDRGWQDVVLVAQALVVPLPDRGRWRELAPRGAWSGLEHGPTGSQLWFLHRIARRTVTAGECEKQARASLGLLREPATPAVTRRLSAPAGYLGEQTISISTGERGQVVSFGAGVSRCYAAVFVSESDADLLERLDLASERILAGVRLIGLDERGLGTHNGRAAGE